MAARAEAIVTAGLRPELFAERGALAASKTLVIAALTVLVLAGFGLRVSGLSAEGLSEDELNKLNAVSDYRQHGLSSANGEHPLLMKALQAGSIYLTERWNNLPFAVGRHELQVSPETALRLPSTIFGALTTILIYLLTTELFGFDVGLLLRLYGPLTPARSALTESPKKIRFSSSSFSWRMFSGCVDSA